MTDPFDLSQTSAYQAWRDAKLASQPRQAGELIVDVADPQALTEPEREALLQRCAVANMAIYRSPVVSEDKAIPIQLARQLGLYQLDGNWLADEDGISPIAVAAPTGERTAFIPYTNRPIKWHTDGYYHPETRPIRAMVLHCVRPARQGGDTALMNHEMAYIALREANPDWVRALMAPEAMTIPARLDDDGMARPEQAGPVFMVDALSGQLHMRYTARTRSIVWKDDAATQDAVAFLADFLASDSPHIFRLRLEAGMGLVCNNVLHDRAGFDDDPQAPRLLYRARYLDRIARPTTGVITP
ncbi:MAG: TauD/TfdA family dioxygenase [Polaromonas sp.]|nr:TauD/TfdA family dioxygenase [Polaromonas sp.]